jgi:formylglycine-generating enzyme required for sulfatase activity/serine/threonine protein kinase
MTDNIKKIGKYAIESEIGRGAMGEVYKGLDPVINRHVAIKAFYRRGDDSVGVELAARFRQEAQAAGRLNHPGIVSVYEYGEDGDLAFIAMELVEGHTLAELIKQQIHLSFEEVSNLAIKMLEALQYAHSKGVVHRDIKPSNIMRTDSGDVKITDFGIARIESSELTRTGTVIGTPGYMSPEQLMGKQVDHRSDIFSCGVLLYELLTGESAFSATNPTTTMYKVVHTELPPASKICPTVPASFDPLLAKALAKNPEDRFASAQAFAQAINAIIQGDNNTATAGFTEELVGDKTVIRPTQTPPGAAPPPASDKTVIKPTRNPPGAAAPPPDKLQHGEQPAPQSKSRRLYLFGAGMLVLVAVGIAAMLWLPRLLYGTDGKSVATDIASLPAESEASQQPVAPPVVAPEPVTPAYRAGNHFKDCATCPDMVVVPLGTFTQGSPASEPGRESNEGPQRSVRVDYPLAVGQFEVTRRQFAQFVSDTGYKLPGCATYEEGGWKLRNDRDWQSPGFDQDESEPVTCVSWEDARRYTDWLAQKTGKNYRLLSASEWEYIARAGTDTARSWGNDPEFACLLTNIADQATQDNYPGWEIHDCMDGYVHTAPVEDSKPNEFGVYGTLGNVFEWVEDCWNDNYQGAPQDGSAWTEGDCTKRSLRGGSWFSQPKYVRSAFRNRFNSDARASTFGFRVARPLPSG